MFLMRLQFWFTSRAWLAGPARTSIVDFRGARQQKLARLRSHSPANSAHMLIYTTHSRVVLNVRNHFLNCEFARFLWGRLAATKTHDSAGKSGV
jgi:hypothetical protein